MITINNYNYKLLLLDTNIISEFIKNNGSVRTNLLYKMANDSYYFCVTFTGLTELYNRRELFDLFLQHTCVIPFFVLPNFNQLLDSEIKCYPHTFKIDDELIYFGPQFRDNEYLERKNFFTSEPIVSRINEENDINNKEDILRGVLSWISGYPTPDKGYSKKDIELWVELVLMKKLVEVNKEFVETNMHKNFDLNKFQSWKTVAYLTFYKFYINNKRPVISDLGDILMSANFPYVDAIVVEKNVKEIVRQLQTKHKMVTHLKLFDINLNR